MNRRQPWILAAIAAVLFAYLHWIDRPANRNLPTPSADHRFPPIVVTDIHRIEVGLTNDTLVVERRPSGWEIVQPIRYPALISPIERFLKGIGNLQPSASISESTVKRQPGGIADYGLGDSATRVTIVSPQGRQTLDIGARAPIGDNAYLRAGTRDDVFLVPATIRDLLPGTVNDWRGRSLLEATVTEIQRIEIRGARSFAAERDSDGGWRLTKPLATRGDGARIEALLTELLSLQTTRFVRDGGPVELDPSGLSTPDIDLSLSAGSNWTARLLFGPAQANGEVWVRNNYYSNTLAISAAAAAVFRQPPNNFRDHQMLPEVLSAAGFTFASPKSSNVVAWNGSTWVGGSKGEIPLDALSVTNVLQFLAGLEIAEFGADVVVQPEQYGLLQPRQIWTFALPEASGATNRKALGFLLGNEIPRTGLSYAKRSDEPGVCSIPFGQYRVPTTLNSIRNWSFPITNLTSISARHVDEVHTYARSTAGAWSKTNAPVAPLWGEAVNELLYRLANWQSSRYDIPIADEAEFLRQSQFKKVDFEITLQFTKTQPGFRKWRIRFGGQIARDTVALINFDDDPAPVSVRMPEPLYADLFKYLIRP